MPINYTLQIFTDFTTTTRLFVSLPLSDMIESDGNGASLSPTWHEMPDGDVMVCLFL